MKLTNDKARPMVLLSFVVITLICGLILFFWYYLGKINITKSVFKDESSQNYGSGKLEVTQLETPFLQEITEKETDIPEKKPHFKYFEVTDSCGIHFEEDCLVVRSGPGTEFPVVTQLRNNIVLKTDESVEKDGITWYKIIFDEFLLYPERVTGDWYVASNFVKPFFDEGDKTIWDEERVLSSTTKEIIVSRTEQKLYAYEGDTLFMEVPISTGLELTPTPRGIFSVFKMTPSRYMQGPLPGVPGNQYYDLPGVPWNLYFTKEGAVIHGAYWHDSFGSRYSHGCVNLLPENAETLYHWAELGIKVTIKD